MSIKGYGTGYRTKERIGKFINPKSRSQNVRYTDELDLLTLPFYKICSEVIQGTCYVGMLNPQYHIDEYCSLSAVPYICTGTV
jgi:hypothetical protein